MRCYRRLLNISYKHHVTNEEVRNRIQNAIGVHDDLLTMVKKRKHRWYGHISRSSGMAKTILQGTVKGARRRGRQRKRWEDNIKEWAGMGFGDSLRAAEDREGWKGIVATSSVVPRRPPRLRDWDEMTFLHKIQQQIKLMKWLWSANETILKMFLKYEFLNCPWKMFKNFQRLFIPNVTNCHELIKDPIMYGTEFMKIHEMALILSQNETILEMSFMNCPWKLIKNFSGSFHVKCT